LGQPFELLIREQLDLNGIETLAIQLSHAAAVVTLPFHHRAPLDRLLIAQAIVEDIPLVSVDSAFDAYPVNRPW
jgi:PIN domain nuclease of toxin-antitoxin system